ncbi:MAG: septum site-determining protein MinC [Lachnospiraceae bacterium]|nr:septum site-determining protein MinC [Lachnospiraceae bacterium]
MRNAVVIKGNKYGMTVILDPEVSFDELIRAVERKFRETARFWGSAQMTLTLEGRILTAKEELQIINTITESSDIEILCLIDSDAKRIERCEKALNEKLMELSSATGQFYKGTLRSGDVLESEAGIVIIGDVEKGARVTAKGNVIILGSLHGTVNAGAAGNINAVVVAFEMAPDQVKISDMNFQKAKSGKVLGRGPMMILVESGRICSEPIKKNFFSSLNFI